MKPHPVALGPDRQRRLQPRHFSLQHRFYVLFCLFRHQVLYNLPSIVPERIAIRIDSQYVA